MVKIRFGQKDNRRVRIAFPIFVINVYMRIVKILGCRRVMVIIANENLGFHARKICKHLRFCLRTAAVTEIYVIRVMPFWNVRLITVVGARTTSALRYRRAVIQNRQGKIVLSNNKRTMTNCRSYADKGFKINIRLTVSQTDYYYGLADVSAQKIILPKVYFHSE